MKKVLFLAVFGTGIASMVYATNVKTVIGESNLNARLPDGGAPMSSSRYRIVGCEGVNIAMGSDGDVTLVEDGSSTDSTISTTTTTE